MGAGETRVFWVRGWTPGRTTRRGQRPAVRRIGFCLEVRSSGHPPNAGEGRFCCLSRLAWRKPLPLPCFEAHKGLSILRA